MRLLTCNKCLEMAGEGFLLKRIVNESIYAIEIVRFFSLGGMMKSLTELMN